MKRCGYCGNLIVGQARALDDDAASGAHAPAYWHASPGDCGPRMPRVTTMDDQRNSPLQRHLTKTRSPRP